MHGCREQAQSLGFPVLGAWLISFSQAGAEPALQLLLLLKLLVVTCVQPEVLMSVWDPGVPWICR